MYPRRGRREGVITAVAALTIFVLMVCVGATADIGQLAALKAAMQNAAEMSALAGAQAARHLPEDQAWLIAATHFRDNLTGGAATLPVTFIEPLRDPRGSSKPCGAAYSCGPFVVKVWYPYTGDCNKALGQVRQNSVCVEAELRLKVRLLGRAAKESPLAQAKAVAAIEAPGKKLNRVGPPGEGEVQCFLLAQG